MTKNVVVGGKGIKGNALRRGFLTCIIGEIDKSRCISYFSTVSYYAHGRQEEICQHTLTVPGIRIGEDDSSAQWRSFYIMH